MFQWRAAGICLALCLAGSASFGQPPPRDLPKAYLTPDQVPDPLRILPPPPALGSREEAADLSAFTATRKLAGAPRWDLAVSDNKLYPGQLIADFDCALGVVVDRADAPAVTDLLARAEMDTGPMVGPPKDHYARERPFLLRKGETCVPADKRLAASGSYPSGHTTAGWEFALILAELAPDRATEILMRGRAFGESRVVCGVHYPSDIEAGRIAGASLVAALHGSAEFRADMEKARVQLAALRASGAAPPDPKLCRVEAEASAHTPW